MDIIKSLLQTSLNLTAQKHLSEIDVLRLHNMLGLNTLATSLFEQARDFDYCLELLRTAVKICPNEWLSYSNMAHILNQQERFEEALQAALASCELHPPVANVFFNTGVIYTNLKKEAEAISYYKKAIDLDYEFAAAHVNLAMSLIRMGFASGWQEYEWRIKHIPLIKTLRNRFGTSLDWVGQSLRDKRLVVYAEQGIGDSIQFSRYIPKLKEMGAYVIFEVQAELEKLLSTCGADLLVTRKDANEPTKVPAHDYIVSLGSLPGLIKEHVAPTQLCTSNILDKLDGGFKIGIRWAGSPYHLEDYRRSCHLSWFNDIAKLPVDLYSLQKEHQMKRVWMRTSNVHKGEWSNKGIYAVNLMQDSEVAYQDMSRFMSDWSNTAEIISQMDLVITVDTGIAHVAGSLGVPTWLLLPYCADWRWLEAGVGDGGRDTDWYPSVRLFRQSAHHDWRGVFDQVYSELSHLICV